MKKKVKKTIKKEIIIMLLLLILVMLIIAVALYDFVPSSVNMPETIEYSSDSATTTIKQEIAYTNDGDRTADQSFGADEDFGGLLKSYTMERPDLQMYKDKKLYNNGNSNPFDYGNDDPESSATPGEENPGQPAQDNSGGDSTTGTFFENPKSK